MRGILRHHPSDARLRTRPPARLFHRRSSAPTPPAPTPAGPTPAGPAPADPQHEADFAVRRVRAAGGPTDEASYTCDCGYVFCAPVSASVACPRCGTEQAW